MLRPDKMDHCLVSLSKVSNPCVSPELCAYLAQGQMVIEGLIGL